MKKTLWDASEAKQIKFAELDYEDFMTNENAVKIFLESVFRYGIALVRKVRNCL